MAKKKTVARGPKRVAKKAPRKVAKKTLKRVADRVAKKKATASRPRRAAPKAAEPQIRHGIITHTELASADPVATKSWCERVLGWKFGQPMPTPGGPYHMWQFPNQTGGGIRANNPPEVPGSIPYCEVVDIQAIYSAALEAGATPMMEPEQIPGGMGWIAIVAAPGGVAIGFWAMK